MKRLLLAGVLLFCSIYMPEIGLFTHRYASAETITTGPTLYLGYEESNPIKNPIEIFMYFIPLTSPVRVEVEKSPGNSQKAWITGYKLEQKKNGFKVRCDFTIAGSGRLTTKFNPDDIIAFNLEDVENTSSNLDYMRFDGGGYGAMKISGRYESGAAVITGLTIDFAEKGAKSPVLVGLYSLDSVDGTYDYANRYNIITARISSLIFSEVESGGKPRMGFKLSHVGATSADGFISSIKATIANLFIPTIGIHPQGNKALLDFGMALFQKKENFTFPTAQNIEISRQD